MTYTRLVVSEFDNPLPHLGLGRHVEHDERSKDYRVKPSLLQRVGVSRPKTVLWDHPDVPLDQGDLGSCTGNAAAHLLGTSALNRVPRKGVTEVDAIQIYSKATVIDGFPGVYPPNDTGSSGLAVMKVLKSLGLVTKYTHAFSLNGLVTALQKTPVIIGVNWRENMFYPNKSGYVSYSGQIAGGHEIAIIGVDVKQKYFTLLNSWGPSWGLNGRFKVTYADMTKALAEDGDVTVPVW